MKRKTQTRTSDDIKARNTVPPGWLTALAEVEAENLVDWDTPAAGVRRFALLNGFASVHAASLQGMGWGFWDVFANLLDECCVFAWQGNALCLVDGLVDRLVLQADELRFSVRKEKYRHPSILRRATRATDPSELKLDNHWLGKGRACIDHTAVIVALLYEVQTMAGLQYVTRLESHQVEKALATLRELKFVAKADLEITRLGLNQIAWDLMTSPPSNLAKARLEACCDLPGDDEDASTDDGGTPNGDEAILVGDEGIPY